MLYKNLKFMKISWKISYCRNFYASFSQVRVRAQKNFQVRANMMIKKKFVNFFVATTKNNKSENLAGILGVIPRWCSQKKFWKIFISDDYMKISSFSFSQKLIVMRIYMSKSKFTIWGGGKFRYELWICIICIIY